MAAPINLLSRYLVNLSTRQLINDLVCNIFGVNFNIVSALAIAHSTAKKRFSRKLVLMLKGDGC